jgi:4-amino-4-deoxy-L-arabinose transferase-like glycosyltransferase
MDGQARKPDAERASASNGSGLTGRRDWIAGVLLPATLVCGLNCLKPLVVDDTAYHAYAAHIAQALLDPYGFSIDWYGRSQPADTVLAPPVMPYWWALGIRLFGDNPVAAKIWLWPWCLILAAAVHFLARRYCGERVATPVTWMIVLSPSVLPSLNLMLDVPALALVLASLAVFLATAGLNRAWGAITAGVLAGLAMQTKYTALVAPIEICLAAWTSTDRARELRRAGVAAAMAASVFFGWELFVAARYGQSHFFYHGAHDPEGWLRRSGLISPLVGLLGSVATPVAILGLAIGRSSYVRMFAAAGLVATGFAVVAVVPRAEDTLWTPTAVVFGLLGVGVLAVVSAAIFQTFRDPKRTRDDQFLVGWLAIELAAYFILTPWPAVRRVIGIVVPMTMLVARRAHVAGIPIGRIWFAVTCSVGLGLFFEAIDIENACIERDAVATIDARIRESGPNPRVGFVGHRGWQYYAERAGWRHIRVEGPEFGEIDWLVIPDVEFRSHPIRIPNRAESVASMEFFSRWELGTIPWYYGTNAAVRRRAGPYFSVQLYRLPAAPRRAVSPQKP